MARIKSKAQGRKFTELLVEGAGGRDLPEHARKKKAKRKPRRAAPSATIEVNMAIRYFVRAADVPPYHPENHTGTTNRRLIGPETVGARNVEVLVGVIEKNEGAAPHAHPDMEQVCYMLEGIALAEIDGQRCELKPGDACFFPAGAMHKFIATSETPVKVLVIYSPPYGESPDKVVRGK